MGLLQPGSFLLAHLNKLPSPRDKRLQGSNLRRHRLCLFGAQTSAELGKHTSIDAISLADHTHRPREVTGLPRIDATELRPHAFQGIAESTVVTASRLEDDPCTFAVAGSSKPSYGYQGICDLDRRLVWMMDVEPIFGNIDTDEEVLHHVPCPVLRGLREQPQSTVQDDFEDAGGSQATRRGRAPEPVRDAVRNAKLPETE